MPTPPIESMTVARMIKARFGTRAQVSVDETRQRVHFGIYDAIVGAGQLDPSGSGTSWGFAIQFGEKAWTSKVFGHGLAFNETTEQIAEALDQIDYYCRLRLGDAYVAEFERAYPPKS